MKTRYSSMATVRMIIACIFFASGVAFSETLRSETQYCAELQTKQESLGSIKEDTGIIAKAFTGVIDTARFTAHEIASFVPGTTQPQFNMRANPVGTLSPQGNTGVVDRGINKEARRESL